MSLQKVGRESCCTAVSYVSFATAHIHGQSSDKSYIWKVVMSLTPGRVIMILTPAVMHGFYDSIKQKMSRFTQARMEKLS